MKKFFTFEHTFTNASAGTKATADWQTTSQHMPRPKMLLPPQTIIHYFRLLSTNGSKNGQLHNSVYLETLALAKQLSQSPYFLRLGLADTSVTHLAKNGHLVLTDDVTLKVALEAESLPVMNFNYLRTSEWID